MTTERGPGPPHSGAPHDRSSGTARPHLLGLALRATAGGSLSGLAAAAVDAHFAWHAAAGGAGSRLSLLLADAGVIAPLALGLGVGVGFLTLALSPSREAGQAGPRALASLLDSGTEEERAERSAIIGSVTLTTFFALVALARGARDALGVTLPSRVTGARLAIYVTLLALGVAAAGSVAGTLARRRPARWLSSPRRALAVSTTL
ncbi:MAG TPA: hypothetical protein VF395_15975, partial [Polyangiaceae bacterium]